MAAMISIENLNRTFPNYPVTISDKDWIYGVWYCSTAWMRTHFYGQYPSTFLKRVLALFPTAKDILHCPSGTITGPGVTVDLISDQQRKPQFIACATALPFADNSFELYISDPPYSHADSKKYGTPPFKSKKGHGRSAAHPEARWLLLPAQCALSQLPLEGLELYRSYRRRDRSQSRHKNAVYFPETRSLNR